MSTRTIDNKENGFGEVVSAASITYPSFLIEPVRHRRISRMILLAVVLVIVAALPCGVLNANASVFPGEEWEVITQPETLGWSPEELVRIVKFAEAMNPIGGLVVYDGKILCQWGDIAKRGKLHSVRKSLISALYGIYSNKGKLDISKTMRILDIDDKDKLTDVEQEAQVIDLLMARSGIYHPAAYETAGMKAKRPLRGSHAPGTYWYYNNWDFNVLGYILEKETGVKIGNAFFEQIARPLRMQDFQPSDVTYFRGTESNFPAYLFEMTARDMARFGLLYLRKGEWEGKQLLSTDWVTDSTKSRSDAGSGVGYGYLWWVARGAILGNRLEGPAYRADGHGGQFIVVIPPQKLVIVNLSNFDQDKIDARKHFGILLGMILKAKK